MFQKSEIFFNKFTQIKYQDKQDKQAQSLDLPSSALRRFAFLSCQGAITHTPILLLLTRSKTKLKNLPDFLKFVTCRLQRCTLHYDAVHNQP